MNLDALVLNLSNTMGKLIRKARDVAMADSNGLVVLFGKATGAKMATYSMVEGFGMMVPTTLVP